jgi:hypothetical protein
MYMMPILRLARILRRFNDCRALGMIVTCAALAAPLVAGAEVGVNVFGFSHHLNAYEGSRLREFNPGAGLQWTFAQTKRGALNGNLGVYQDSYGHANWHLSLGARVRLIGGVWVGAQLIDAVSPSLNKGYPVVTPYPLLTVRLQAVDVNMAYIPEVGSFNGLSTLATFVTVHPWGSDDPESDDDQAAQDQSWQALEFTIDGFDSISGLSGNGLMWRHMFDEGHGLRLGTRLSAELRKYILDGTESDTEGSYKTTLLLQYLRRHEPRGHVRPYWATGLETDFEAGRTHSDLDFHWRTDVGIEYALSRNAALALESGLSAGFRRFGYDDFPDEDRREWYLSGPRARMMFIARRGGGDTAGRPAAAHAGGVGSALLVMLGPDLTVTPLEGGAIAWRRLDDTGRGWRWSVQPVLRALDEADGGNSNYGLTVRAEHIRRRVGDDGVADYWGFGPLVSYGYSKSRWQYGDEEVVRLFRSLDVGVGAVVGAEIRIVGDIHLMAEYSASLKWRRELSERSYRRTSWHLANDDVRLGLAVGFGN